MPNATSSRPSFFYVDTQAALKRLCQSLAASPWLAIDTEFLRESSYYPKLCLLQIAGEQALACIDPLKLADLTPVWQLVYAPDKLKVFHAGRQDLEIFYHLHGRLPEPVFDTQVAAALLGYPEQIGYAQLVAEILSVRLNKSHTRSDWSKRPLEREQIGYAIDDVRYLPALFFKLRERLNQLGRLAWLAQECAFLTDPATYANPPQEAWRRIPGASKLSGRALAILKQLAAWREETAQAADRPRGWIAKDELLCQIAKHQPQTPNALAQIDGIDRQFLNRYADTICQIVAQTQTEPAFAPEVRGGEREILLDCLSAIVKLQAAKHGLNPALLASRKDLEHFLASPSASPLCQGWRQQVIGAALSAFLAGHKRLQIEDGQLCLK